MHKYTYIHEMKKIKVMVIFMVKIMIMMPRPFHMLHCKGPTRQDPIWKQMLKTHRMLHIACS